MKKVVIEALNPLHGSINYLKELRDLSRRNRNNPTKAEEKIWRELLKNKKTGFTFLRQKPINRFIVDFYCSKLNLAIEIDGNSHDKKLGYDQARDKFLKQIGVKTIRFTNDQILFQINQVKNILSLSLAFSPLPCQGKG